MNPNNGCCAQNISGSPGTEHRPLSPLQPPRVFHQASAPHGFRRWGRRTERSGASSTGRRSVASGRITTKPRADRDQPSAVDGVVSLMAFTSAVRGTAQRQENCGIKRSWAASRAESSTPGVFWGSISTQAHPDSRLHRQAAADGTAMRRRAKWSSATGQNFQLLRRATTPSGG